jgi:hypothetical protein
MTFNCELENITRTVKWACLKTGVKNEMVYKKKRSRFYERLHYVVAISEVFGLYVVIGAHYL